MRNIFLLLFFVALIANVARAEDPHGHKHEEDHHREKEHAHEDKHEDEHEEGGEEEMSSNIGPGFAVTEADHEKGFKLSEKAVKTLGLEWKPIQALPSLVLPQSSVVHFKDEAGVYRLREGWIKLIEGDAQVEGDKAFFMPNGKSQFKTGDQVVVRGVPLLRVTELDAFSGSESGHAH